MSRLTCFMLGFCLLAGLATSRAETPADGAEGAQGVNPRLAEEPMLPSLAGTVASAPMQAPKLLSARYEVDVYGGMARGTLIQRFEVDRTAEFDARYALGASPALTFDASVANVDGREYDLSLERLEPQEPTQSAGGAPRSRRPAARPSTQKTIAYLSDAFPIADVESVELWTRFGAALPLESGHFRLRLPLVLDPSRVSGAVEVPVRIAVAVHHDAPLRSARSRTHEIIVDYEGDRSVIELVDERGLLGQAFELELALGPEDEPNLAGYVGGESDGRRAVTALLEAPVAIPQGSARPKQVLFLLDTSGSMRGQDKLEQARRALRACLAKLGPQDTFNIVEFDDRFSLFAGEPTAPTAPAVERATRWIEALLPDRGTKLLAPLEATLTQPPDAERHRLVVLVTDGVLHDEDETLALLERELGDGRLFVVGIGPSMRQQTILRLVEFGRGGAAFANDERELESAVTEMFDAISQPLAWDLAFDWGGATVEEVRPARFPDLYAGRPVKVLAWVRGDLPEGLRVRVSTTEGERAYTVRLPPSR